MASCYRIEIIGKGFLDTLPDTAITPIKNLEELTEIDSIKISGAYSTSIPISPFNKRCLDRLISKSPKEENPNPIKVRVWKGPYILDQDTLYVVSKDTEGCTYSVRLTYGGQHWAELANDCQLCDIFDEGDTFEVSKQNVIDNWQSNPSSVYDLGDNCALFAPVNYGDFVNQGQLSLEDLRPWFSLSCILKKAFQKLGWCLKAPILETEMFRSMWVYILGQDYNSKASEVAGCHVRLVDIQTYDFFDAYNSSIYNPPTNDGGLQFSDQLILPSGLGYSTGSTNTNILNPVQYPQSGGVGFISAIGLQYEGAVAVNKAAEYCICIKGLINVSNNVRNGMEMCINLHYYDTIDNSLYVLFSESISLPATSANSLFGQTDIDIDVDFCFPSIANYQGRQLFITYGVKEYDVDFDKFPDFKHPVLKMDLVYDFKAKRKFYGDGSTWNYKDVVDCDKTVLDFIKGFIHLISGKVQTDFRTNTVCIFPPKTVTLPNGEVVEGFQTDEVIDFSSLLCDNYKVSNPNFNKKKCQIYGYQEGDEAIEVIGSDQKDTQYTDQVINLGTSFSEGCNENRNPFFQPTAVEEMLIRGDSVHLPIAIDNDDDEISYDLGCRIAISAPSETRVITLPNGVFSQNEMIRFCGDLMNYPLLYQSLVGDIENTQLPSPYNQYSLDYSFLYDKFLKWDVYKTILSPEICFKVFLCDKDFFSFDFRSRILFSYDGIPCYATASKISLDGCDRTATICVYPEALPPTDCTEDEVVDVICQNAPSLICTKNGDCYDFTIGGTNQAVVSQATIEYQEQDSTGQYPTTWTPLAAGDINVMTQLCDVGCIYRVRALIEYDDFEGIECPDLYTTYCVIDPCGNRPSISIDCFYDINGNPCFKIIQGGTVNSEIDSIELTGCETIGTTVGSTKTYQIDTEYCIEDLEEFCLKSWKVNYADGCKSTESTGEICKTYPPEEPNCDNNDLKAQCVKDGDCWTFELEGNLAYPWALRQIQYKCDIGDDWINWNLGDDPICCEEIWSRVVVVFCDDKCPTYCADPCYCADEIDCELEGALSCTDCTIVFTPTLGDPSDWTATWCLDGTPIDGTDTTIEAEDDGLYEIKFNKDGCDEIVFGWDFTKPEAGDTDNDENNPKIINE